MGWALGPQVVAWLLWFPCSRAHLVFGWVPCLRAGQPAPRKHPHAPIHPLKHPLQIQKKSLYPPPGPLQVGLVDFFLPFFPLERRHIRQLFDMRLAERSAALEAEGLAGLAWDEGVVDFLTAKVEARGGAPAIRAWC